MNGENTLSVRKGDVTLQARGFYVLGALVTLSLGGLILWGVMTTQREMIVSRQELTKAIQAHAQDMHIHNINAAGSHDSLHRDVAHLTQAIRDMKTTVELIVYASGRLIPSQHQHSPEEEYGPVLPSQRENE